MADFIQREQWTNFLNDFTKRNQFRATRLEIAGEDVTGEEAQFLPLVGVSLDSKGTDAGSVVVALGGENANDERHLEHQIMQVERITPISGQHGVEDGLAFEDGTGNKTVLMFDDLPELQA
ncbi:MAG TPA: DUF5335 family protein [Pyrinomonadaceae bacterium]|nr:DUF5335 family protein [Pyrinomonadaceae bacterium]